MTSLLEDSLARAFAPFAEPVALRAEEEAPGSSPVWTAIHALGVASIFTGGSDDPWTDSCAAAKAAGRNALAAPLVEHLAASELLAASGVDHAGPIGLVPLAQSSLEFDGAEGFDSVSGTLTRAAFGRTLAAIAAPVTNGPEIVLALLPLSAASVEPGIGLSREPRDTLVFAQARPLAAVPCDPDRVLALGALMRAAQLAGACEAILAMTVKYAQERSQFGRAIGAFQAIQHQIAIMAGHTAAATRAADAGFARAGSGGDIVFEAAVAKSRAGEAASACASIAHQTHGAIGFTDEHRLHYWTRRIWTWRGEFGSDSHWTELLGRRAAEAGADGYWPMVTAAG